MAGYATTAEPTVLTHPKRPTDPNQLAKSIIDIATGEKPDRDPTPEEQGKDLAAWLWAKKGGAARAASRTMLSWCFVHDGASGSVRASALVQIDYEGQVATGGLSGPTGI